MINKAHAKYADKNGTTSSPSAKPLPLSFEIASKNIFLKTLKKLANVSNPVQPANVRCGISPSGVYKLNKTIPISPILALISIYHYDS
jgi:hypothetical protein